MPNDVLSILDEITKGIDKLPDSDQRLKELRKYQKLTKRYAEKSIKNGVNSTIDGIVAQTEMFNSFIKLKQLFEEGKLSYDMICLSTPASDKINCFAKYAGEFDDKTYWKELAYAYMMQDHKEIQYELLKGLFTANRKFRKMLMDPSEQRFLKSLPDEVEIFRGGSVKEEEDNNYGISWSLNMSVAQSFAEKKQVRTGSIMKVHQMKIEKKDIVAVFLSRNEDEVIWVR